MSDFEQKNKNILSRFETDNHGTHAKSFSVQLKEHAFNMISLNGITLEDARNSAKDRFGSRLVNVTQN